MGDDEQSAGAAAGESVELAGPGDPTGAAVAAAAEPAQLTDEQKERSRLARELLLQSPPGSVAAVASDLKTMVGDDAALGATLSEDLRAHNTEQMVTAEPPAGVAGGAPVLVCAAAEVSPGQVLDPSRGKVLGFDHVTQVCTGECRDASESELGPEGARGPRAEAESELAKYVAKFYPGGAGAVYALEGGGAGGWHLLLALSSAKFSPPNFWAGRWRSVWKLVPTEGGRWDLEGLLRVQVHYYEEGNVQMTTSKEVKCSVAEGGKESAAAAAVAAVEEAEGAFCASLAETYNNFNSTTFKELRRLLPVTRTKFPWETHAAKLAGELQQMSLAAALQKGA